MFVVNNFQNMCTDLFFSFVLSQVSVMPGAYFGLSSRESNLIETAAFNLIKEVDSYVWILQESL